MSKEHPWPPAKAIEVWDEVPEVEPIAEPVAVPGGTRQEVFFSGPPWQGRETMASAYLGIPDGEGPHPAMVLIHGGGGSAFPWWVEAWVKRGYVAIAPDTCGCRKRTDGDHNNHPRHERGGPPGWGNSEEATTIEDQWAFHATAITRRARALLGAMAEVDSSRIGIEGVSWGGIITLWALRDFDGFAWAIPIYGCAHFRESNVTNHEPNNWIAQWDSTPGLPGITTPTCWINGARDLGFFPPAHAKSYRDCGGAKKLCYWPELKHEHRGGLIEEGFVFADEHAKGGPPLPRLEMRASETGFLRAEADHEIRKAFLAWTEEEGPWKERSWQEEETTQEGKRVTAAIPRRAQAAFLRTEEERGLTASTPCWFREE